MILEKDEILQIRSDLLFHDMFNANEMDTIEWTVMQILNKNYEEIHGNVTVSNLRIPNLSKSDKQKYLDLIVKLHNETIVIELNNNTSFSYTRNLMYVFSSLVNSYTTSDNYYLDNNKAILVNLNWFRDNQDLKKYNIPKEEIIYPYPKLNNKEGNYIIKIININLDYYNKICYDKVNKSDTLWKLFTIKNKHELKQFINQEKLLQNYENKLLRLSESEEYCKMVWDERIDTNLRMLDSYQGGYEEGVQEGIQKGVQEKQKEMIINMYQNKLPIEDISKYSNLSVNEVKKIINDNK